MSSGAVTTTALPAKGSEEGDGAVRWVDVDLSQCHEQRQIVSEQLCDLLGPDKREQFGNLVTELVADLVDTDDWPEVADYGDVHKLSLSWMIRGPEIEPRATGGNGAAPIAAPSLSVSRIEVAVTRSWIISVWHPVETLTQPNGGHEDRDRDLPSIRAAMREAVRRTVARRGLETGGDAALAMLGEAITTCSDLRKDLHARLDRWEHDYYERHFSAAPDAKHSTVDAQQARLESHRATRTLAEVHSASVDLSRELDHLTAPREQAAAFWVGEGNTSSAGDALAEVLDEKVDRQRASLRDIRDRVRAGLELSHSVDSTRRDAEARRRDSWLAKIAAVFLAPTLVAGFFGINTKFPDHGTERGTIDALVLMVLSAVAAWAAIEWFGRRGRR